MKISSHFQKFFFGVVCPQLKDGAVKRFKETGRGMGYKNPYTHETVYFDMRQVPDDAVYHFLKLINPHYPRDETQITPLSTTLIDTETMMAHIQWVERWAGLNGIELQYIAQSWEKLLAECGISKDK